MAGCGGVQGVSSGAGLKDFPSRSVELTVPYAPGGSTDLISRSLADSLKETLGQSVVVLNKPGGGGVVGARQALGSSADGHSLVTLSKSQFTVSPLIDAEENRLDLEQLQLVSGLTTEEYALVVNVDSPYQSLKDLLASGTDLKFGFSGVGTGTHYLQEVLFKQAGVNATGVPFDGSSAAITALLGNHVNVGGGNIAEVMSQVKAGKLRPLAVFSPERSKFLPEVPTAKELGYDLVLDQRRIIAAPKDVPEDVVKTLAEAIHKAEESKEYQDFLAANYVAYWGANASDTKAHLEQERKVLADKTQELQIEFGQSK
jgi:tripartite-type tricarboxylate transporter receptor subunit TctC